MPFSHHSHSGQFCEGHAKNSLEDVIRTAIAKKMSVFALSEHMPREEQDFYPEEVRRDMPDAERRKTAIQTMEVLQACN
ncbi:hypothetical protein ACJ73_04997 [Blastomyces percursus]|uniref:Histidinol-phosphatase n=1 Tax=Blastomyces percursus TaxID=1658174 RepID=A0A1J9R7M8_9EURO|nr:hypothetical protein ACJ73_04997 [Blastomyces percursus]